MDTAEDARVYAVEDRIRRRRAPFPCDEYQPCSKQIDLCSNCGHPPDRHPNQEPDQ